MDDLVDDRDVLLLARAKDLEHEYENLVRSLDAAYDAVKQINTAMSENRSEAKHVFQQRLELLASRSNANNNIQNGNHVNAVTRNAVIDNSIVISRGGDGLPKNPQTVLVTGGQEGQLARYFIALAGRKNKGATKTIGSAVTAQNNSSRTASDATAPSSIYYSQSQRKTDASESSDATSQSVGIKRYVGDEHSYAEIDTDTGLLGHSVTDKGLDENHSVKRNGAEIKVDLSIVKSEFDESNDEQVGCNSTADDPFSSRNHSASESATPIQSTMALITKPELKAIEYEPRWRQRKGEEKKMDNEALLRKRVLTRNRMRRWRAKRRLLVQRPDFVN